MSDDSAGARGCTCPPTSRFRSWMLIECASAFADKSVALRFAHRQQFCCSSTYKLICIILACYWTCSLIYNITALMTYLYSQYQNPWPPYITVPVLTFLTCFIMAMSASFLPLSTVTQQPTIKDTKDLQAEVQGLKISLEESKASKY